MAIIGKIREKFGVLLAVIIGLALFGFLLSSALNDNFNVFKGNNTVLARVDGEKIDAQDFFNKVNENTARYQAFNNGKSPDEATRLSLRDQTWAEVVNNSILEKKYSASGIVVTTEEMVQQCSGNNPHQVIRQNFSDPKTGQYDPASVSRFKNTSYKENKNNEQQVWHFIEKYVYEDRIKNKYNSLIKKAVYVPKWQAAMEHESRMTKASFEFVSVPFTSVSDSAVKPTDEELNTYIKSHSAQFQNEDEARKIEYVVFDLAASREDSAKVKRDLSALLVAFHESKNDSSFVFQNSDESLNAPFTTKERVNPAIADSIFSRPARTVFGPYIEGSFMKIAKMVSIKNMPDSVRARHILINVPNGQDTMAANRKIDSLWSLIKKGADFGFTALQYSQDGSKEKLGDLGFFAQGQMVPEFNDACFNGKKGDIVKVKTQFGVHLIQITDQKGVKPSAKIYYVAKSLKPSKATEKEIYARANMFAGNNNTAAKFDTAVIQGRLNKRIGNPIRMNDNSIPGFASLRDLVKWTFKAKIGDVSGTYSSDDKLVVAKLAEINEAGLAKLEAVRPRVEAEVRNEKKAAKIMADLTAKTAGKNSLAEIGAAIGDTIHKVPEASFASPFIPMAGFEPAVIGHVFSGKYTTGVSKAIKGNNAIFFVHTVQVTPAPATPDYTSEQTSIKMQYTGNIEQSFMEALKKQIKIKDYRSDFY